MRQVLLLAAFLLAAPQVMAELPQKVLDAAKTSLETWELDYADHPKPKVNAGDNVKGYRVIFTKRYDEDIEKNVSGGKPRYNHVDLVLVPQTKGFDQLDAKTNIPWSQVPEEYFTTPRWIGTGLGFEWFCRTNLTTMDSLRKELKLSGGEPRMNILCSGLSSDDRDNISAKYAVEQLQPFGKAAIPGVIETISSMIAADKIPHAPMYALKGLDCQEAKNALLSYAAMPDKKLQVSAGDALCLPPYIANAKPFYLKMLSERRNINQCGEAARQLSFQAEATPLLEQIANTPSTLFEFRDAMVNLCAIRSGKVDTTPFELADKITAVAMHNGEVPGTPKTLVLGEKPETTKAKLAEHDLKRLKPLESQLAACPDKDLAFVAALWLCMFKTDADIPDSPLREQEEAGLKSYANRVRESGMRVLRALPSQNVEQKLAALSKKNVRKAEADEVRKILRRYVSTGLSAP